MRVPVICWDFIPNKADLNGLCFLVLFEEDLSSSYLSLKWTNIFQFTFVFPSISFYTIKQNKRPNISRNFHIYFQIFSRNICRDRRRRHSVSLEEKLTSADVTPIKHKDSSLPPLTFLQSDDQDRRPSLAELQAEDMDRRPSITMYQSVDSQHPDVIAIQKLVERMKFGEIETVESWKLKIFFYSFAASVTKHNFNEKCF